MKTYWDLSEKERSELSEAGVEAFLGAELMTKGVLKVSPPVFDEEPDVTLPKATTVYRPSVTDRSWYGGRHHVNVGFETAEQAQAFLALKPFFLTNEYFESQSYDFGIPFKASEDPKIEPVEIRSRDALMGCRADLEKQAAIRKSNLDKRNAYEADAKAQKEALDGLWKDWLRCRSLAERMARVRETLEGYTATADGERAVAERFLRKVFNDQDIIDASDWFGFSIDGFRVDRERGELKEYEQAAPEVAEAGE